MKYDISLIPYGLLTKTLAGMGSLLERASKYSSGRSAVDDIVRLIYAGTYSLWVVFDTKSMEGLGFFAIEVKQYPQKRMLCIQHCVMENGLMKHVEDRMEELAVRYAQSMKCDGVEFVGRPGWRRFSKQHGYASHSVVYQQMFDKEASHV